MNCPIVVYVLRMQQLDVLDVIEICTVRNVLGTVL